MAEPVHPVPLRKPFCWIFGEPVYLFRGQTGSKLRRQHGLPTARDLREQARRSIASEAAAAAAEEKNLGNKLSGTTEENPSASGTRADLKGKSLLKDLGESRETKDGYLNTANPTGASSGTRDEVKGKFVLNHPRKDLSESSETEVIATAYSSAATDAASGTKVEVKGNPVLKRPRQDPGQSSESVVEYLNLAADSSAATDIASVTEAEFEVGSVRKRHCQDV